MGTRISGVSASSSAIRCRFAASRVKSNSSSSCPRVWSSITSSSYRVCVIPSIVSATCARASKSRAICVFAFGRWILTATTSPPWVTARWTWLIDADPSGSSSKAAKTSLAGFPKASSISPWMTSGGSGSTWSCSRAIASMYDGGSTLSCVERICPILMYVGPSFSRSFARSSGPGASSSRTLSTSLPIPMASSASRFPCRHTSPRMSR